MFCHGHGQAQHLLHLELHGVQNAVDLLSGVFAVGDHRGELAGSVQTRTHETRQLLDQSVGSEESVVLLGELADQLLVLVQVGDLVHVHAGDVLLLANLLVLVVHEDAHVDVVSRGVGQHEGTSETLVLSGIDLLQGDLQLHGLHEVSLLSLHLLSIDLHLVTSGIGQNRIQSLVQNFAANLAIHS